MGRVTAESYHGLTRRNECDLAGNRFKATCSTGRVVESSDDCLIRSGAILDGNRLTRYGFDSLTALRLTNTILVGDKGFESDPLRQQLEQLDLVVARF